MSSCAANALTAVGVIVAAVVITFGIVHLIDYVKRQRQKRDNMFGD